MHAYGCASHQCCRRECFENASFDAQEKSHQCQVSPCDLCDYRFYVCCARSVTALSLRQFPSVHQIRHWPPCTRKSCIILKLRIPHHSRKKRYKKTITTIKGMPRRSDPPQEVGDKCDPPFSTASTMSHPLGSTTPCHGDRVLSGFLNSIVHMCLHCVSSCTLCPACEGICFRKSITDVSHPVLVPMGC